MSTKLYALTDEAMAYIRKKLPMGYQQNGDGTVTWYPATETVEEDAIVQEIERIEVAPEYAARYRNIAIKRIGVNKIGLD